jgi:hypothetical protein
MKKNEIGFVEKYVQTFNELINTGWILPGLITAEHTKCLAMQLYDSRRRIEYIFHIRDARHSPNRMDPNSALFDPLKAAVLHSRTGNLDEAFWLVFIAVHFGKHATYGWRLAGKIYGQLGGAARWDWLSISSNPNDFQDWLRANQHEFKNERFSNHRKYESISADSSAGTAAVFKSYVDWIMAYGNHKDMIRQIHTLVGQNPHEVFDYMYRSMSGVKRFGRLGRFDFLTMLGKLGLAPIEPGSAYLWHNATGPQRGARLLFGGTVDADISAKQLDRLLVEIDSTLNVGMQTLEDSLCNWQKSPTQYEYFKG